MAGPIILRLHCIVYSGTPLIRTPEMWSPLYSGHLEKSQSLMQIHLLKCGHPSNKDTFTGSKGGRFRGVPLYQYPCNKQYVRRFAVNIYVWIKIDIDDDYNYS